MVMVGSSSGRLVTVGGGVLLRNFSFRRGGMYNVSNYPVNVPTNDAEATNPTTAATPVEENDSVGSRVDYNGVGRMRCYNCGQMGHISYDCRVPQVRKACYLCGNAGHVSRDCPQRIRVTACFYCKNTGHMAYECPEKQQHEQRQQAGNPFSNSNFRTGGGADEPSEP